MAASWTDDLWFASIKIDANLFEEIDFFIMSLSVIASSLTDIVSGFS